MLLGKIYVAGHTGMVGAALVRELTRQGVAGEQLLTRSHRELDLRDQRATREFFAEHAPDYVFLAAARVGGIQANIEKAGDFTYDNLMIQTNVIDAARRQGVQKLLFIGSSCMYPRDCEQPMRPEHLLSGPLESTNRSYVLAKLAGMGLCQAYRQQHGCDFITVLPPNLYGPGDNYGGDSHVVAALLHRFNQALSRSGPVPVWGDGTARREFMYVEDFAKAAIFVMTQYSSDEPLNIGVGEDIAISSLARLIAETVGLGESRLCWDAAKPIGVQQKLMDSRAFRGWWPWRTTPLAAGLRLAYKDYLERGLGDGTDRSVSVGETRPG